MKISVKVKARAKEDRVLKVVEGEYKVWVKTAPEKGRANEAVIAVLSEYFNIPKGRFSIVTGQTSSQKMISIQNSK